MITLSELLVVIVAFLLVGGYIVFIRHILSHIEGEEKTHGDRRHPKP